jgi:hypothetical protein
MTGIGEGNFPKFWRQDPEVEILRRVRLCAMADRRSSGGYQVGFARHLVGEEPASQAGSAKANEGP